jgi:hypothetical protein
VKPFTFLTLGLVALAACNAPQQPAGPVADTLAIAEPEPVPSAFSTYDAEDDAYLTEAEFVSGFVASNHAAHLALRRVPSTRPRSPPTPRQASTTQATFATTTPTPTAA